MLEITTTNCNYHLTRLYKEHDKIGTCIDQAIVTERNDTLVGLEKEYASICSLIDKLIEFRRNNDCLIEGDQGYGPK